jgi:hypothetical protein
MTTQPNGAFYKGWIFLDLLYYSIYYIILFITLYYHYIIPAYFILRLKINPYRLFMNVKLSVRAS